MLDIETMQAYESNARQYVPAHTKRALDDYLTHGFAPGSFLDALLCNDLMRAFGSADDLNVANMFAIVKHLHNDMPIGSFGSRENVDAWIERKREKNTRSE